ncbi:hypothetical protein [Nonomuraea ferruginea]
MSTDRRGYAMATPDEAAQALRAVARLAEEQGDALDRAFRLFGDGALLGPRAARLHAGLVDRCAEVGRAFTRAFRQVERLATARGDPPRVPAPHPRRPPVPLREPPGGFVGGDPDLMQAIDAELAEVAESWQLAGQSLAATLVRVGLDSAPGQDVVRAGAWLADQRPDLRRRRADLLKTTPAPAPDPPPQSAFDGPALGPATGTAPGPATGTAAGTAADPAAGTANGTVADTVTDTVTETVTDGVTDTLARVGAFWADQVAGLVPAAGGLAHQYAERVAVPLAQGAAEAVIGAARFGWEHSLGGLITNPSGPVERARAAYDAGEFAAEHPLEFAKSAVDWKTLTENPARWFGRLIPEVLLGAGTAATRAGRLTGAATRAGPRLPDGSPIPPPRTAADGPPLRTIPMRRQHVGEERTGVRYLDEKGLASRRLVIHDGKLYDVYGRPFDTTRAHAHFSGKGRAIFVMDRYGNLYANSKHVVGEFHHSSFLRGGEVAAAGDVEVKDGVLKAISRHSGHYRPGPEALRQAIDRLRSAGVDFTGVSKEGYTSG